MQLIFFRVEVIEVIGNFWRNRSEDGERVGDGSRDFDLHMVDDSVILLFRFPHAEL